MQENIQLTEQEKNYIYQIISSNTKNVNNIHNNNVNTLYNFSDYSSKIFTLIKGLSVKSIKNKKTTLNQYKTIFIHLFYEILCIFPSQLI